MNKPTRSSLQNVIKEELG